MLSAIIFPTSSLAIFKQAILSWVKNWDEILKQNQQTYDTYKKTYYIGNASIWLNEKQGYLW